MKRCRTAAWVVLAAVLALSLAAGFFPGGNYATQHRELTNAPPSARFPLGTDDLGRDRMVRLLCATRISLLLAAAAALGALLLAAMVGGAAGYLGGWFDRTTVRAIDLMLSLPWLFLLIAARALLPLNAAPETSLLLTYCLLALLGWAAPARVVRAGVRSLRESDFVLQARALGCPEVRVLIRHILPNLRPVLLAQFWTSIPIFILAEANLGFLGLSASEPFPTWGNLLRELQSPLMLRPEAFAPVVAVMLAVLCFKFISPWGGSQV
ncbi:MAG TPA: ABC transporter permease [Bryobacteraceae bacterium]|jgi:ABC-type dipeptide/oligopeptide/nickel transport system permease subunit|nr:ABC transporter permease [Bryobacteraceae bacterium]